MKSRIAIPVSLWALLSLALLSIGLGRAVMAQPHGPMGAAAAGPSLAPATLDAKQDVGSVMVTVVAGSLEKPLTAVEVTINGPGRRVVRTNAAGQALFEKLSPAEYFVSALADGKPLRSEGFALPESGGVAVVLSTIPMGADRGGRPSARMMSGRARPESNDPGGRLTIRAIQGELEQSQFGGLVADIPEGARIHLVGLHADNSMRVQTKEASAENEGRVVFDNLARDHSVAYYAMSIFERSGGSDRLMTQALQLPPQVGSRMMFAGAPKASASRGIDDLESFTGTGQAMPEAGVVRVQIYAEQSQRKLLANTSGVELIEIGSKEAPRISPVREADPSAAAVIGRSGPMDALPGTEPGQVSFYTVRPSASSPLPGIALRVERSEPNETSTDVVQTSNGEGHTFFRELEAGVSYVAIATVFGKEVRSEAFVPSADKAQTIAFAFEWPDQQVREARFESVVGGADKIFIAKVFVEGRQFLSLPFQLTRTAGAAIGIYMYPELLFSMHGGAELDDTRLWFQTQISIANPGVAPLKMAGSGLSIPLPQGFVGASVADEMASRVGVESDKGFLWRGAVPPGQRDFIASFALPVEDGSISFDMALPHGLRSGRLVLEDMPGMQLRTPAGAKVVKKTRPNGKSYLEMPEINIAPLQRLVFGVNGLPQHSAWARRVRIGVGIVAIVLVLWVFFVIFVGRRSPETIDPVLQELEANREKLLRQLVKLETEHRHKKIEAQPYQKKRDRLSSKLADAYRKIDEHKATELSVS